MPFLVTAILIRVAKLPINEAVAMTHKTAALMTALVVKVGASSNDDDKFLKFRSTDLSEGMVSE